MSEANGFDESKKGLSIVGFILGIVSLFIPFVWIPAIIVSAIALGKKRGLKGLAIAGLVLGIVSIALSLIALIALGSAAALIGALLMGA